MTTKTAFDGNVPAETKKLARETIDRLVTLNRDAVEGFNKAAELLNSEQYQRICKEFAEQRERFINELVEMTGLYGGTPTDNQSIASVIHGAWMSIRDMVSGEDAPILAECDRGEEVAVETYEAELKEALPSDVKALLNAQLVRLKETHARIHNLATTTA